MWVPGKKRNLEVVLSEEADFEALVDRVKKYVSPKAEKEISVADSRLVQNSCLKILKKYPEAVALIKKEEQTEEMINNLICKTSPKTVDRVIRWIDLSLIKPEMAPLLLGCESTEVKNFVEKSLHG